MTQFIFKTKDPNKHLDSTHDLSIGERAYLKEHKISEREFNEMNTVAQHEWKREFDEGAYVKGVRDLNKRIIK